MGLPLAAKKKIMSYKHFGFARSAFPGHKNIFSEVEGPERGERVMLAGTESWDAGAAGRLRSEQKSNFLLQELKSRVSQPEDLVVDQCAGTF